MGQQIVAALALLAWLAPADAAAIDAPTRCEAYGEYAHDIAYFRDQGADIQMVRETVLATIAGGDPTLLEPASRLIDLAYLHPRISRMAPRDVGDLVEQDCLAFARQEGK